MSAFPGEQITLKQLGEDCRSPLLFWKNVHGSHTVFMREHRCFVDYDIVDAPLYGWLTPANATMTDRGIRKYLNQSRAPQTRMHHYFFLYQYCMRSCPYCAAKLGVTMTGNHSREGHMVPDAVDKNVDIGVTISGGEIFMSEPYQDMVIAWLERHKVKAIVALTSATYATLKDKPLFNYFLERGRATGDRHIDVSMYITLNGHEGVPLAHPAWGTPGYRASLKCVEEMYEHKDAFKHILVQVIANRHTPAVVADLGDKEKTIYTLNAGRVYGADGREEEYSVKSVEGHKVFHDWYQQNYFDFNDDQMTTAGKPDSLLQMRWGLSAVDSESYHVEWPRETKWKKVSNFSCKGCKHNANEMTCMTQGIAASDCQNTPKMECLTCPVFDACVFSNGRTHVLDYAAMECDQQRRDMVATLSIKYKRMTGDQIQKSLDFPDIPHPHSGALSQVAPV